MDNSTLFDANNLKRRIDSLKNSIAELDEYLDAARGHAKQGKMDKISLLFHDSGNNRNNVDVAVLPESCDSDKGINYGELESILSPIRTRWRERLVLAESEFKEL